MQSFQYFMLSIVSKGFQILPASCALWLGRACGWMMYCLDVKHRNQVYQNLKTVFLTEKSMPEIHGLARRFFINLGANVAEFLRLPVCSPEYLKRHVTFNGIEHFHEAMSRGKGAVLMTLHYGNWELPMLAFSSFGYPENLIYKAQARSSGFNRFMLASRMTAYQRFHQIRLFERGMGARKLFESLKRQELIGMVIDQGGKEGVPVEFFGRTARFSDGGIRLAFKTGAAMCAGGLIRRRGLNHELMIHPFEPVMEHEDEDQNVQATLQRAVHLFEQMIRDHPEQYMWMYKFWKSDQTRNIMILDDGRVGHLRQSQAAARAVAQETEDRGGDSCETIVPVRYRYPAAKQVVLLCAFLRVIIPKRIVMSILKACLSSESFNGLWALKPDVVISAGSLSAPVNALIAREHRAKAVALLRPSALPFSYFDAVILPEHDLLLKQISGRHEILTKGAPNLVDDAYLKDQSERLMRHYSHLKLRNKFMIGVLIGGDTKSYVLDESTVKILSHQIKEAAEQLDADIMITTSRRTSEKVENVLIREFKKYHRCHLLVIANRNNVDEAVGGILGMADVVVVSGDSISMISEAASSGKRTVVFPVKRAQGAREDYKHNRFVDRLNKEGYVVSSDVRMVGQAIFNLAKNKIVTRKLDDTGTIRKGLSRIL